MLFVRLGLALAVVAALAIPADALTVSTAKVADGAVQIKGGKAGPLATVTWEGAPVAMASKSGSFKFSTTVLPAGCVGTLGDGDTTTPVVIAGCGPPGADGSPGPPGPPGAGITTITTAVEVGNTLDGNPTTLGTFGGVRIVFACVPAHGVDPVQAGIQFYNDANGGKLLTALLADSPNSRIDSVSGLQFNPLGLGPDTGVDAIDVHGVVFPVGATGGVHVDIGTYVTASQILPTSFCHFFGTATPLN